MTAATSPAISVLMVVRNGGRFLEPALASLAAQTFGDFEIILVDNGSSDGTAALAGAWAAQDPRLRVFHLAEPGLAASLNFAAAQARAPLLAKLDGDDLAHPRRLERQHRAMAERPSVGVLACAATIVDGAGRRLETLTPPLRHSELRERLRHSCPIVHSSAIVRTDLFRSVGGYRDGLNLAEDYDLWSRLAERCEFAALSEPLVSYRVHRGSLTSRQPARIALASFCVAAAGEARRRGAPEPFVGGVPAFRRACNLARLSREQARQEIRVAARRAALSRKWLNLPLPAFLRSGLRGLALGLNLRPLYVMLLTSLPRRRRARAAEPSLQEAS